MSPSARVTVLLVALSVLSAPAWSVRAGDTAALPAASLSDNPLLTPSELAEKLASLEVVAEQQRQEERQRVRDATHAELKALGLDVPEIDKLLALLAIPGKQGGLDEDTLARVPTLFPDTLLGEKAGRIARTYAETMIYGAPILEPAPEPAPVQVLPILEAPQEGPDAAALAAQAEKAARGGEAVITAEDLAAQAAPSSGSSTSGAVVFDPSGAPTNRPELSGTCLSCPSFNFGPFTPTTSYVTHSSATSASGDCNWYQFNTISGHQYNFTTCSPGTATFDTIIEAYCASSCTLLASNDDSCGLQSLLTVCATSSQTNVKVRGFSTNFGSYTLAYKDNNVSCTPGVTCAGCESCSAPGATLAAVTTACQYVSGATTTSCPSKFYNVSMTAGIAYTFTLCPATCASATANYDSRLRLYNPSCAVLVDNDDSCGLQSEITYTATVTGTHRIEVTGFSTSSVGSYTLGYKQAPCDTCAAPGATLATPTATCQYVSGSTTTGCPSKFYNVSLTSGLTYVFTLCPATCASATANYDSRLRVYSPACAVLVDNDDFCSLQSQATYTATSTGTYRVEVTGFSTSSVGSFTMGFEAQCESCAAPGGALAAPTAACQYVSNSTSTTCPSRFYSVLLTANHPYVFTFCSATCASATASYDTRLRIYDPSCVVQVDNDDSCGLLSEASYTPSVSGTFKIEATGFTASNVGSYTLGYKDNCVSPSSIGITPTAGAVSSASCSRTESFTASVGAGTTPYTYSWTIVPPAGGSASPASGSTNPLMSTLTGKGTYSVSVTVTNPCGGASQTVSYVLSDTTAPVIATCPAPTSAPADANCLAPVPDRRSAVVASDNCTATSLLTITQTPAPGTLVSAGTTALTETVTDASGNASSCTTSFTVQDTTPPTITCSASATACPSPHPLVPLSIDIGGLGEVLVNTPSSDLARSLVARAIGADFGQVLVLDGTTSAASPRPADASATEPRTVRNLAGALSADPQSATFAGQVGPFTIASPDGASASALVQRLGGSASPAPSASASTQDGSVEMAWVGGEAQPRLRCSLEPLGLTSDNPSLTVNVTVENPVGAVTALAIPALGDASVALAPGTEFTRTIVVYAAGVPSATTADAQATICLHQCTRLGATAVDNCTVSSVVLVSATPGAPACGGNPCIAKFDTAGDFVYTWRATDASGNTQTCTSTVHVHDSTDPVCNNQPSCDAGPAIGSSCRTNVVTAATGSDPNNDALTYAWTASRPDIAIAPATGFIPSGPGPRPIPPTTFTLAAATAPCAVAATVTLTVNDGNGGISSCTTSVTFDDNVRPTLAGCPANTTAECSAVPPPAIVTASDNCDPAPRVTFLEARANGACQDTFTLTRTWTGIDQCGNQTSCSQTVTVRDTTPPTLAGVPAAQTVECSAVPAPPVVSASDNCDPAPRVSFLETRANGACQDSFTLTRTWTATDRCGNAASQSQTVTVRDTTPPTLAGVPAAQTVECSAVPAPAAVTASDNCDPAPRVSFLETRANGACQDTFTLTRTWTATDRCGNSRAQSQTLTVRDTTVPTLAGVPAAQTVECSGVPAPAAVTASDNCDPAPRVSFLETRANGACQDSYTLTRTWTATDRCGNSASQAQTITVRDTTSPTLAGVPAAQTVECSAVPAPAAVTASDNCDPAPRVSFLQTRANGACQDTYTLTRTWTATDRCGNSRSQSQTLTVRDTTAPVLAGVPPDATVECDSVPAPATPTASDNCDPTPGIVLAEVRLDGPCPGSYVLTRTWTATDRCANASSRRQVLTVVDTTPPVIVEGSGGDSCLWPPNHVMACYAQADFHPVITDNCSLPITWKFVGCASDEPADGLGDGSTADDCDVAADGSAFCVRAERQGLVDTGRHYAVTITATDACGNTSAAVAIGVVSVPHDGSDHADCREAQP